MVVETNLQKIPMKIGNYYGIDDSFPDQVYRVLNADQHVYRHYKKEQENQIDLYIGYYGTAKGGRTGHNPYACFPSSGWGIIETGKIDFEYSGGKATINLMVVRKGNVYQTVMHWYQSDKDKILDNGIQQNVQRFLGRVVHNRNDGAFIRVSTQSDRSDLDNAKEKVKQFVVLILPFIIENWPEER